MIGIESLLALQFMYNEVEIQQKYRTAQQPNALDSAIVQVEETDYKDRINALLDENRLNEVLAEISVLACKTDSLEREGMKPYHELRAFLHDGLAGWDNRVWYDLDMLFEYWDITDYLGETVAARVGEAYERSATGKLAGNISRGIIREIAGYLDSLTAFEQAAGYRYDNNALKIDLGKYKAAIIVEAMERIEEQARNSSYNSVEEIISELISVSGPFGKWIEEEALAIRKKYSGNGSRK